MISLDDIKQMLAETGENTLTLYLNVDNALEENQAVQPAWKIWLKDTLRRLAEENSAQGSDAKVTWNRIHQRLEEYLQGYTPNSRGLALFAGPDFLRPIELPLNMENQAFFGKAAVTPLLWELDEHEPYLIALIDQEKTRMFLTHLGSIGFEDSVELDIDDYDWAERTTMHGPGPGIDNAAVHGGTGKDDFQKMIGEFVSRFYRQSAGRIGKVAEQHGVRRIILGGVEESARAVEGYLAEPTKKLVIDIVPIPLRSSPAQIQEIALERARAYERAAEVDLVNQVIDFAKSGGRGALGAKAVMEALEMRRVELLIMPWPMDDASLAAELPLRAFASGGSVELVHGEAADRLKQEGGLAARLYYVL